MSATPEQIAIDEKALEAAHAAAVTHVWSGPADDRARDVTRTIITAYLTATNAAQAERVRVLEEENEQLKIGLQVAERLYRETLGMKGDAGYG